MSTIVSAIEKAASHVTSWPEGRKIDNTPSTSMAIYGACLGPATTAPDTSTPIGTVEAYKIEAPPDDPNRGRPSIWSDMPAWMAGGLW